MHYQVDQSTGQHDFDLEYADGSIAALEVTISTDQTQESTFASITNPRKCGGASIKTKLCKKDWYIHPEPTARISKIRALADKYLHWIEIEGVEFFWSNDASNSSSVDRICEDLGIDHGSVVRWKNPGQIMIALPGRGGFVLPENLQKAIEVEACKFDNRRKLGAASSPERHLFVYVSSLNFLPWAALVDGDMPAEPPELPEEITDAWAVTAVGREDRYLVWKATRTSTWQRLGIVSSI